MSDKRLRSIRIDDELYEKAAIRATREGMSLSKLIRELLTEYTSDGSAQDELRSIATRIVRVAGQIDRAYMPIVKQ